MGKSKKKVESIRQKKVRKEKAAKSVNPFEVKINRRKFSVLGKKLMKHEHGMPGVSKAKASKTRKATLLHELNRKGRVGKVVDRRIGLSDKSDSIDDIMLKRFAKERLRNTTSEFSEPLKEDEVLTHQGQSLAEIERFNAPQHSDDEDDRGTLGAEFGDALFGGFLKEKEEGTKSWKEKMEEMISTTRKERHERQLENEKTAEMTEKLDNEWKKVHKLKIFTSLMREGEDEKPSAVDSLDFDSAVREFRMEAKVQASDKLKTPEEMALEEKARLEKLEADRIRRMTGAKPDSGKKKKQRVHFSADALEEDYLLEDVNESLRLEYTDSGEAVFSGGLQDEISDEEQPDDDSDKDQSGSDEDEDQSGEEEGDDASGSEVESEAENSDNDSFADVQSSDDDDEEAGDAVPLPSGSKESKQQRKAAKELPYTFEAPTNYDNLQDLMLNRDRDQQLAIVERLRKLYHVSLADNNRQKLETLFSLLLRYTLELSYKDPADLKLIDLLSVQLWHLAQVSPDHAAQSFRETLEEKVNEHQSVKDMRGGKGVMPLLDTLVLLRLGGQLFPTSDKRHPVTTPLMIYLSSLLTQNPIQYMRDVVIGLYLCTIAYQYISLSGRLFPEAVNFLQTVILLASPPEVAKVTESLTSLKRSSRTTKIFKLDKPEEARTLSVERLKVSDSLFLSKARDLECDRLRLCSLWTTIKLTRKFFDKYQNLPSCTEIFSPFTILLKKLDVSIYPQQLKVDIKELIEAIEQQQNNRKLTRLSFSKRKPGSIKMFQPKFVEKFTDSKAKGGSKSDIERKKLNQRVKREMKGALRDLRRDKQAIARHKLKETVKRDAERKRKVRIIKQQLAEQEGDFRKIKRSK